MISKMKDQGTLCSITQIKAVNKIEIMNRIKLDVNNRDVYFI
jgi:hypothetical protein